VQTNPVLRYPRVKGFQPIGTVKDFPYVLCTASMTEHWCAGSVTRNVPWLNEIVPEPWCELPEKLAQAQGIRSGDLVKVSSARGEVVVKALVTHRMEPLRIDGKEVTTVWMPYNWGFRALSRGPSTNNLTIDAGDLARLKDDVARLRPLVDIVVVSHHNRDGATPVQFGDEQSSERSEGERADRTRSEEYQKVFARTALDAGADLVFGHGTHTIQGVELYRGKPILYAVGHSAFDQPGYENSKDGLVVRVLVNGKKIRRVSIVPVTRDATNTMIMTTPREGEGLRLADIVRRNSPGVALPLEGQELVLLGPSGGATSQR